MKQLILSFSMLFLSVILINSQTWSPDWSTTNSLSGSSADAGFKIIQKGSFVYVVGQVFDGSSLSVPYALRTLKYNTSGTIQWSSTYSSSTPVSANGIDVDDNGNVYITGTKDNGSNDDYITIKYNSTDGSQSWATQYDGGGQDEAGDIGVVTIGGETLIFVTGGSFSTSDPATMDMYTIRYFSSNGGSNWANRFNKNSTWPNTNGDDKAWSIAIDNYSDTNHPSYGLYIAGWYHDGNTCGGDCRRDAQIVHFTFYNSTPDGSVHYGDGGNGDDFVNDIAVSPVSRRVYATGAKYPAPSINLTFPDFFTFESYWVDDDFVLGWCNRYDSGENDVDVGMSIAIETIDSDEDNVYATGYSVGDGTGNDIVTIKYLPTKNYFGEIDWVSRYNSSGSNPDAGLSIGINSTYAFVTGFSGYGGSNSDIKTIQYTLTDGSVSCISTINGSSNIGDNGNSLSINGSNIYLTGVTNESNNFGNSSDIIIFKLIESDCEIDEDLVLKGKKILMSTPKEFSLLQNYPNPFNPITNIRVEIPKNLLVSLKVYDLLGKEIFSIIDNVYLEIGKYSFDFNAVNLPSGIYYYKLQTPDFTDVKKMVLIK